MPGESRSRLARPTHDVLTDADALVKAEFAAKVHSVQFQVVVLGVENDSRWGARAVVVVIDVSFGPGNLKEPEGIVSALQRKVLANMPAEVESDLADGREDGAFLQVADFPIIY